MKRSFCDRNIANFKQCILHESWDFVYESNDLQTAFSRLQGVIDLHLNTNFMKRTFTMNYKNRYPWITEALREKIKCKNQLHAIAVSSHDGNIMKEYKEAKKVLHSALRNSVTSMRVLNGQARYEIADTENMGIFHAVLHYRIGKRTKKH